MKNELAKIRQQLRGEVANDKPANGSYNVAKLAYTMLHETSSIK